MWQPPRSADVASTPLQEIDERYVNQALELLLYKDESTLLSRLSTPAIKAAMLQQGLEVAEIMSFATAVRRQELAPGPPRPGGALWRNRLVRCLAQVMWEAQLLAESGGARRRGGGGRSDSAAPPASMALAVHRKMLAAAPVPMRRPHSARETVRRRAAEAADGWTKKEDKLELARQHREEMERGVRQALLARQDWLDTKRAAHAEAEGKKQAALERQVYRRHSEQLASTRVKIDMEDKLSSEASTAKAAWREEVAQRRSKQLALASRRRMEDLYQAEAARAMALSRRDQLMEFRRAGPAAMRDIRIFTAWQAQRMERIACQQQANWHAHSTRSQAPQPPIL